MENPHISINSPMKLETLEDILNKNGTDKGNANGASHSYANFYDSFLKNRKDEELLILEIGIAAGASIKSWYEYCPNSTLIGLDIEDKSFLNNERTFTFKLDQSNKYELENFVNQCRENGYEFDFILDDGSHHMYDQQITLGYLFPVLKSKGVYFLEDLHTSLADNEYPLYGKNLDIGLHRHNTTLFYLMESMHSQYCTYEQNDYLNKNIDTIQIYNTFNNNQEPQYKHRSITSAIVKK